MIGGVPYPVIDRRSFLALGASMVAVGGCSTPPGPGEAPRAGLVRLLGLAPDEEAWLDSLTDDEQRRLFATLASPPAAPDRRSVDLLMKVLGRRERLFAYVGYPPLPNGLTACDGLLRE